VPTPSRFTEPSAQPEPGVPEGPDQSRRVRILAEQAHDPTPSTCSRRVRPDDFLGTSHHLGRQRAVRHLGDDSVQLHVLFCPAAHCSSRRLDCPGARVRLHAMSSALLCRVVRDDGDEICCAVSAHVWRVKDIHAVSRSASVLRHWLAATPKRRTKCALLCADNWIRRLKRSIELTRDDGSKRIDAESICFTSQESRE
jgi:hypothetical protein